MCRKFVAAGDFAVQPYIVMEAIAGKTLLPRLPELPLPYAEVAEIGVKVATALDDLHRQHVVHLDIKPSNIMFRPTGEAVLLDFGLSHHDQSARSDAGGIPPAVRHGALHVARAIARHPQRSAQRPVRAWASCSISSRPACGRSAKARRCAGCAGGCGAIRCRRAGLRADYPPWLQEIVLRCLEIEPAWRYPTAAQLAFDLSHPTQVKLTTRSERLRRDPLTTVLRRRFNKELTRPRRQRAGRPAFVRADRRRRHRSCRRLRGAQ